MPSLRIDTFAKAGQLRWINAELEDHPPQKPLEAGKWYTLAFDVDLVRRTTAVAAATFPLPDLEQLFPQSVDEIRLTVQVDSTDFDVSDHIRPLRLPRSGRGTPKHALTFRPFIRVLRNEGHDPQRGKLHPADGVTI